MGRQRHPPAVRRAAWGRPAAQQVSRAGMPVSRIECAAGVLAPLLRYSFLPVRTLGVSGDGPSPWDASERLGLSFQLLALWHLENETAEKIFVSLTLSLLVNENR